MNITEVYTRAPPGSGGKLTNQLYYFYVSAIAQVRSFTAVNLLI
ncbi:hypothetical protein [Mucilaginibacter sp.]